ncbi:hypothetical protein OSB04_020666 [Centaurea solstitialis]|uniref:Probable glutathione S-transferase n=1 Tax=Centaurea solstitialis TaxID=347529 RepID=A0AA38TCB1_9ASTR|nr:hypothetical protein OSB04_020666 [Centaurea solstitialis]
MKEKYRTYVQIKKIYGSCINEMKDVYGYKRHFGNKIKIYFNVAHHPIYSRHLYKYQLFTFIERTISYPKIQQESRCYYHRIKSSENMADEVKLYALGRSPFVCRVKIALHLKGIEYENFEEDLSNKSSELVRYNPVYKKVPVLVHNGKPISESLVIVEYIDDVWKGFSILPEDPYEKAVARFWAKFIEDKCDPSIFKVYRSNGDDEHAIVEAWEQLQVLENELAVKGSKFFGGDNINLVDIAAVFIAYWPGIIEEVTEIKLVTKDKFPKLTEWADNFVNCQVVKEVLPTREHLLVVFKKRFGKA